DLYPGEKRGWGNVVIIRHNLPDGRIVFSQYAHLDQILVEDGDPIGMGEQIGTVGQTGFATGPHLHLEIKDQPVLGAGYRGFNFGGDEIVMNDVRYYR